MKGRVGKQADTKRKSSRTQQPQQKTERCKDCEISLDSQSKALTCDFCRKWVCTSCLDIPDDLYEVMSQNPSSHLLATCKDCAAHTSSLHDMQKTLSQVKDTQDKLNSQVSSFHSDLKSNITKIINETLSEKFNTLDDKIVQTRENISQEITTKIESQVPTMVRDILKDEKEAEKRRPNLIIYNVQESTGSNMAERIVQDRLKIENFCNALTDLNMENLIQNVIRLGKTAPTDKTKSRPIKVIFSTQETKFKVLSKSYKIPTLKNESHRLMKITIDRTPKEEELHKQMVAEIETRRAQGEEGLVIYRGAITKKTFHTRHPIQTIQTPSTSQKNTAANTSTTPQASESVNGGNCNTQNSPTPPSPQRSTTTDNTSDNLHRTDNSVSHPNMIAEQLSTSDRHLSEGEQSSDSEPNESVFSDVETDKSAQLLEAGSTSPTMERV